MSIITPDTEKNTASLEAHNLGFTVNKRWLVRCVNWAFRPGAFTVLLGPNGAGKTTLLKMLSGDLAPSEGKVELGGEAIADMSQQHLARQRAVLPQQSALAFPLMVEEVVAMGRGPFGDHPAQQETILHEVMEQAGVSALAGRNVLTLSGGERQRVHLARVLAQVWSPPSEQRPCVLLLDEPTNALDLRYRGDILRVAKCITQHGHTVIAVLHDLNEALGVADDALLLHNGNIAAAGPADTVIRPAQLEPVFQVPIQEIVHPETAKRYLASPVVASS